MPRHFEKRVVAYSADQMFDLVADIESYPSFLPWCQGAAITSRSDEALTADLLVGTHLFRDRFTSVVTMEKSKTIRVAYGGGPLAHLSNEWRFAALDGGRCELSFFVDFRFRSHLLGAMMDAFFDTAFRKIVAAFEKRAQELYGAVS